jgi:hypothetical protein
VQKYEVFFVLQELAATIFLASRKSRPSFGTKLVTGHGLEQRQTLRDFCSIVFLERLRTKVTSATGSYSPQICKPGKHPRPGHDSLFIPPNPEKKKQVNG